MICCWIHDLLAFIYTGRINGWVCQPDYALVMSARVVGIRSDLIWSDPRNHHRPGTNQWCVRANMQLPAGDARAL